MPLVWLTFGIPALVWALGAARCWAGTTYARRVPRDRARRCALWFLPARWVFPGRHRQERQKRVVWNRVEAAMRQRASNGGR